MSIFMRLAETILGVRIKETIVNYCNDNRYIRVVDIRIRLALVICICLGTETPELYR